MKITVFTSNKSRHNYLINLLSELCDELFVIQETSTIFPGVISGSYEVSKNMEMYFKKVNKAQLKIFGNTYINNSKSIKIFPMLWGDLNKCSLNILSDFLKSDIYIIFGSSFIKNELLDHLVINKAVNIHMGISPYYRGTDCNFWALYDNNPHLVGATIHLLSKGLDSGPILYHALSNSTSNPFEYTMSTVKSAFYSLSERIRDKSIHLIKPMNQDKLLEIRYSKRADFNETALNEYLKKNIDIKSKRFDLKLLKDPFFYKNN